MTVMLEIPLQDVRNQMKSLHQDQEELTVCLRVLKNRQDIEEKKTAKLQQEHGGLKNRLDIEEKKTADLQQEQGGLKNRLDIEEKKTAELQEEQGGLKSRLDIEARKRNQGLEALNIRMDNIDSKMATTQSSAQNLKESLTLVSPDGKLICILFAVICHCGFRYQVPLYSCPVRLFRLFAVLDCFEWLYGGNKNQTLCCYSSLYLFIVLSFQGIM